VWQNWLEHHGAGSGSHRNSFVQSVVISLLAFFFHKVDLQKNKLNIVTVQYFGRYQTALVGPVLPSDYFSVCAVKYCCIIFNNIIGYFHYSECWVNAKQNASLMQSKLLVGILKGCEKSCIWH